MFYKNEVSKIPLILASGANANPHDKSVLLHIVSKKLQQDPVWDSPTQIKINKGERELSISFNFEAYEYTFSFEIKEGDKLLSEISDNHWWYLTQGIGEYMEDLTQRVADVIAQL